MQVRIVGVAPAGFHGLRLGERTDFWIPRFLVPRVSPSGTLARARGQPEHGPGLLVFGRLRAGLPLRDAQVLTAADLGKRLIPINDLYGTADRRTIVIGQSSAMWMAAITAALLLLAGSATLMALVVVHLERRRKELAVRTALGCSTGRMVAMLVGELALLATIGLAGAVATGVTMLRILPALRLPGGLELARIDMSVDWRVLAAGAGIATTAIALGAITPIRRVLASNVSAELGVVSGKSTTSSFALRRGTIVFHVAATVVVLVAAGLFVRTIVNGLADAPGFDVDRTLFLQMTTRLADETAAERDIRQAGDVQRLQELLDRIGTMPGVEAVSLGRAPIRMDAPGEPLWWPMTTSRGVGRTYAPSVTHVDQTYFDVLGIRLLAGRTLTTADFVPDNGETVERPAVITRDLAEALWPGSVSIGQSFGMAGTRWRYHIVGVVGDHVARTLTAPHRMGAYIAGDIASSVQGSTIHLAIRSPDPDTLVDPIRRLAAAVFPQGLDLRVVTGRELVRTDLGSQRLAAWLFTSFGLIAVVIGLGGVFGLVGYLAESRRREMGIRIALGAKPGHVLRTLVAAGLAPVVVGVFAGVTACLLLAGYVESRLVGVTGSDPLTYGSVVAVVLLPAGLAGLAAAWRIRRISPSDILHDE
jgi:predicted permease